MCLLTPFHTLLAHSTRSVGRPIICLFNYNFIMFHCTLCRPRSPVSIERKRPFGLRERGTEFPPPRRAREGPPSHRGTERGRAPPLRSSFSRLSVSRADARQARTDARGLAAPARLSRLSRPHPALRCVCVCVVCVCLRAPPRPRSPRSRGSRACRLPPRRLGTRQPVPATLAPPHGRAIQTLPRTHVHRCDICECEGVGDIP